jgi:hypothetical protein
VQVSAVVRIAMVVVAVAVVQWVSGEGERIGESGSKIRRVVTGECCSFLL